MSSQVFVHGAKSVSMTEAVKGGTSSGAAFAMRKIIIACEDGSEVVVYVFGDNCRSIMTEAEIAEAESLDKRAAHADSEEAMLAGG